MLSNAETNGVMLIDFERSSLLQPPRRPLAQLVPNKRKRGPGNKYLGKAARKPQNGRDEGMAFAEETSRMRSVFLELDLSREQPTLTSLPTISGGISVPPDIPVLRRALERPVSALVGTLRCEGRCNKLRGDETAA
ncbi:uncharacterized protein PG998_014272 [Apiospora kogelbergensis]|uniref:Uncharacterized protein n=1 Tax=Apiospora kogelbergensis TaxID=1337665 RepID=A0AAW0QZR3_9PEZI